MERVFLSSFTCLPYLDKQLIDVFRFYAEKHQKRVLKKSRIGLKYAFGKKETRCKTDLSSPPISHLIPLKPMIIKGGS